MNPILFLIAVFVIIDLLYVDKYLKKLAKENSANKFYEVSYIFYISVSNHFILISIWLRTGSSFSAL